MRPVRAAIAAIALTSLLGCASSAPPPRPIDQATWLAARARLADLRAAAEIGRPYVEVIRVAVREPRTGRVLEGRGAVAVDPHRAMRMILIGPGGSTALDVWATKDAWRFSVPGLEMTRRGKREASADLPIGFFRWWFIEPLDGRLLSVHEQARGEVFVLREREATVVLQALEEGGRRHFVAVRREGGARDRLEWVARRVRPGSGDRARYTQLGTGLEVEVLVEAVSADPPDAAAFVDPDDPGLKL